MADEQWNLETGERILDAQGNVVICDDCPCEAGCFYVHLSGDQSTFCQCCWSLDSVLRITWTERDGTTQRTEDLACVGEIPGQNAIAWEWQGAGESARVELEDQLGRSWEGPTGWWFQHDDGGPLPLQIVGPGMNSFAAGMAAGCCGGTSNDEDYRSGIPLFIGTATIEVLDNKCCNCDGIADDCRSTTSYHNRCTDGGDPNNVGSNRCLDGECNGGGGGGWFPGFAQLGVAFRRLPPGTLLSRVLALVGHEYLPGCSCRSVARDMDRHGRAWCRTHRVWILAAMRAEAERRAVRWSDVGARLALWFAILWSRPDAA